MQFLDYIKRPYPFYYTHLKKVFFLLCFIAIASFLFTYLFEPFVVNVNEHKIDNLWIITLHSIIPVPVAFVYFFFLHKSVKNIESWTLGKEFLHLCMTLVIIGLVSFLIRNFIYSNPDNWSLQYFWEEIRNTFLVGSLILIIILPLNMERLISKHSKNLKLLPNYQKHKASNNLIIKITTPINEENFELNIAAFLYAKADGNYTDIFFLDENKLKKVTHRVTLSSFEIQLKEVSSLVRCHRSYMVNLNKVKNISGNAQGLKIELINHSEIIPVSRKYIPIVKEFFQKNS